MSFAPTYGVPIFSQRSFIDPRVIDCSVEYTMNTFNFQQEAIATIKMRVDPEEFDVSNPMALNPSENVFGTLIKENGMLILKQNAEKIVLGDISDPETFKKIYMYYIDDLYTK